MAQIDNRGPNTWQVRVFLGRSPDGKRMFHTKTIKGTKKDAERYATKVQNEHNHGVFVEPTTETVNGFLDQWLIDVRGSLGARTFDDYEKTLVRYIRPTLGSRRLLQVTKQAVQSLYTTLLGRGLSGTTVRHAHGVLSAAMNYAVAEGKIARNPATGVKLPKKTRPELRVMSADEAARFVEACSLDKWGVLFTFALTTGMRPGEVLGLRWRDVDLNGGLVMVRQALITIGAKMTFAEPKTKQSRRTLSLPPEMVQALREHKRRQAAERLAAGESYSNHDLVFASEIGTPLSERNLIARHFKPILQAAGLPKEIRWYDLRHTCATLLLQTGENIKVVSERLGHASVTLTLDTYTHVLPTMQQSATDKLGALLFGSGTRSQRQV